MEVLAAIRTKLSLKTDEQKTGLLGTFKQFLEQAGNRQSNSLSYPQFKVALIRLGIKLNEFKSREVFSVLDKDGSGKIDFREFVSKLFGSQHTSLPTSTDWAIGMGMVRQQRTRKFADQQTRIRDADTLLKAVAQKAVGTREQTVDAFKVFRRKANAGSNQISLKGFKAALRGYGINYTAAAAAGLFTKMDSNKTGTINYQDFVKHLTSIRASNLNNMDRTAVDYKHVKGMRVVNRRRNELIMDRYNKESTLPVYTSDPLEQLRAHILQSVSSQTMLLATFKRFSLQTGSGNTVISLGNFKRGLKACGVMLPPNSIESLFHRLDTDDDGHIDLPEFARGIFSKQHTSLNSTKDHYVAMGKARYKKFAKFADKQATITNASALLQLVKRKISRSVGGVAMAYKLFRTKADAGSNAITLKQFREALKGFLIPHTEQAARDLFSELDIDGNGTCDYGEFLKGIMRTDTRVKLSLDRTQDYRNEVGMQGVRRRKADMRREAALQPRAKSIASTIDPLKVLKKKISSTISGPGELLLKYKNFKAKSGTQSDHVNLRAFKRVLAACGIKMKSARDQERAKAIFHKLDADNNGTIDFNEFVQGLYGVDRTGLKNTVDWGIKMAKIREMKLSNFANKPISNAKVLMKEIRRKVSTAGPTKHQVTSAFRRFHHVAAGTQTIDLKDFNAALKTLSINATPLAVESLFYDIDNNHSGEIDFKEFVAAISDEKMRVRTARRGRLYKAGLKGKKASEITMLKRLYPNLMQVDADEKVNDLMLQTPEQLALLEAQAKSRLRQKLQDKLSKTLARHTVLDSEMQRLRTEFGLIPTANNGTANRIEKKPVGLAVKEIFGGPGGNRTAPRRSRRRTSDLDLKPRYKPRDFTIGTRGLSKSI